MQASVADSTRASGAADLVQICAFRAKSVELALKSFLLARGLAARELKKFGHNLIALLGEAEAQGLRTLIGSSPINAGVIRLLNIDYSSKRFDYRESGARYLVPDETLMRQVIGRLLRGVMYYLNRHVN